MTITVNLVGAGRVGRTFLRLLAERKDIEIGCVASSTQASASSAVAEVGTGRAVASISEMAPADVWFLTVPDSRIAEVAEKISQAIKLNIKKGIYPVAIHCSGYHAASVMMPLAALGWRLVSAHPMLSFADPEVSAERFPGTWCGVEGDESGVAEVEALLEKLKARPFRVSSEGKVLYHAAAVFTNNFTTVLQAIALEAWEAAGVPEEAARELNATLLKSTHENIERLGPAEALTGPAARGDADVVREQGRIVSEWDADAGQLYEILSQMAARLKATGRTGGQS